MSGNWTRNAFVYLLILVAAAALFLNVYGPNERPQSVSLSDVARQIERGEVARIDVRGERLQLFSQGSEQPLASRKEEGVALTRTLEGMGVSEERLAQVEINVQPPSNSGNWFALIINLLPLILIAGLFLFLFRQSQSGNNQALSFGKSKARMFVGDRPTVTFSDVAGADEAKQELEEIVEFLKEPQKFVALGARIPKGVLLVGPPGTGKTLMAKAVSGEAGVPFFSISGSEFVEMFVGVGASRVRDLFEQAKRNSPCIVFIDEIDAVGRYRGTGLGGSHDEREQTLNQILVEMDGFGTDTNVILVAATNRPDILDPALLRPGRFDRRVTMDRPDLEGRRAILDVHVKGKPLDPNVNLDLIARQTPGFVGADLENLVNEAAILAARRNRRTIAMTEMQESIERIAMGGPERRSRLITDRERRVVAYHESGHAIIAHVVRDADPLRKVSIIPRGMSGGVTLTVPERDRYLLPRSYFVDRIAVGLGGRVAEEIVFGDISNGASDDIQQITRMARAMVMKYGMSDRMGPLQIGSQEENPFLGRELTEQRDYSEEVAEALDSEVQRIVNEQHDRVRNILRIHRLRLDAVAEALLERETLEEEEFVEVFEGNVGTDELPNPLALQPA
ncbi:MAG: ATP-dependent zinc metalloprotease FtsH [Caldilineaceae bacterium SB0665_bin_25]|nr:ATP-dependent zinc metalloprotease FtsH [Caldilineaceae bacterium SB0665_bin_25]